MSYCVYLSNPFITPIIPLLAKQWDIIKCWEPESMRSHNKVIALATTVWNKFDAAYLAQFPNLN